MTLSTSRAAGDPITAADINAIAAAVNANDPTTTKGDLIVRAAAAVARLGVGADGQVLTADSTQATGLAWTTGSGGGGAPYTWTKVLDTSPMTSLTGWVSRTGTWTPGGTYGVNQTANDSDDWLEFGTSLSGYDLRAIRATIRLTGGQKVGFGFNSDQAWTTSAGGLGVALDLSNNTVWWDRYGTGGGTASQTVTANTDYTFMVVERSAGVFWVYVNGALITKITAAASVNTGRVGLYCRTGQGWFRDVTIWGGVATFNLPS